MSRPLAPTTAPRDERGRLLFAFADAVYEQGYAHTRLADVALRAGVPLAEVERRWQSEDACAVDALTAISEQTFSRVAEAFMSTPGDCPLAAHRALAVMLEEMARVPAMVYLCVIELPNAGAHGRDGVARALDQFAEFLGPGFAALGFDPPDPETVSAMISGGVLGILRSYALERRTAQLSDALTGISYVCVSTFFGIDEARRVLALSTT